MSEKDKNKATETPKVKQETTPVDETYKKLLEKVAALEKKLNNQKSAGASVASVPIDPAKVSKEQEKYLLERVPFRAFKDNDKYKDDLSVQVNGKIFQIQRGKTVMIPRYVLFAIEQNERQKAEAAEAEDRLVQDFEDQKKSVLE